MHKILRSYNLDADVVAQLDLRSDLKGNLSKVVNEFLKSLVTVSTKTERELYLRDEEIDKEIAVLQKEKAGISAQLLSLRERRDHQDSLLQTLKKESGELHDIVKGAGL